jgi:hypothetical protein
VQAFKDAVYGPQHDQEEADAAAERAKGSIASQKRKAAAEVACKEAQNYDWGELADTGKVDILMSAQCATLLSDEQSNESHLLLTSQETSINLPTDSNGGMF